MPYVFLTPTNNFCNIDIDIVLYIHIYVGICIYIHIYLNRRTSITYITITKYIHDLSVLQQNILSIETITTIDVFHLTIQVDTNIILSLSLAKETGQNGPICVAKWKASHEINVSLTRALTLYSLYLLIGMLHESCHLVSLENISLFIMMKNSLDLFIVKTL
jgi:hypothetical protein